MAFSKLKTKIWYWRKRSWRNVRVLFPSPAEVHFLKLMGAKAITIDAIKYPTTHFPLTIIYNRGKFLKRNFMQREVRVGGFYVDFGFVDSYSKCAIEIDGSEFHRDHIRESERDEYLNSRGWRVLHIEAMDLYRQPVKIQQRVISFLSR